MNHIEAQNLKQLNLVRFQGEPMHVIQTIPVNDQLIYVHLSPANGVDPDRHVVLPNVFSFELLV
jgi:hypothetical protein